MSTSAEGAVTNPRISTGPDTEAGLESPSGVRAFATEIMGAIWRLRRCRLLEEAFSYIDDLDLDPSPTSSSAAPSPHSAKRKPGEPSRSS
jgi:hypothetical protein